MIKGLTHDENGIPFKVTKFRGKISAGYAPNEAPNTSNSPKACGFFRMTKEVTINKKVGTKVLPVKEWVLNKPVQEKLEQSLPTPNKMPRRVEFVCLYKTAEELWESSLSMYGAEGLLCHSHGAGTPARQLTFSPDGERMWGDRKFNGKSGCLYTGCEDFKRGKCKPIGLMKCFPTIDLAPNPYRFETRSINTIKGIESSLQDLNSLLQAAHAVKTMEAGERIPYEGFFGMKLYLIHKKIKSGGREVFITDLMPTDEFTELVMEPIKRGIADKEKSAKMLGAGSTLTSLEEAGSKLLGEIKADDAEISDPDNETISEESSPVAEQEAVSGEDLAKKAVTSLLNDDGESPEKS